MAPPSRLSASLAAGAASLAMMSPTFFFTSPTSASSSVFASAKLADRHRFERAKKNAATHKNKNSSSERMMKRRNRPPMSNVQPIEAANHAGDDRRLDAVTASTEASVSDEEQMRPQARATAGKIEVRSTGGEGGGRRSNGAGIRGAKESEMMPSEMEGDASTTAGGFDGPESFRRNLSSQLTGCCTKYIAYGAADMCEMYGQDCDTGQEPSHDSGDEDCSQEGLSFIGISFSVNTAMGNPYSYQLCDQFPMEYIIDRDYDFVMSMDEDGWLVGGGYKSFDYSGKMPYIDSSHTELLRIGSIDPEFGGTSIEQVYDAMESLSFPPFSIFPEYVKGGGQHHSSDSSDEGSVPSGDVTLIVSVVDTYDDNDSYSTYEEFTDNLFDAMDAVSGGPCMDDHDTDPHVSMSRGVKFKSSYHQAQYFYKANLEVAVWQAMYPAGVVIGTSGTASFPPDSGNKNKVTIGYGSLFFFFDRANITQAFLPNRDLSNTETYYSTLYSKDSDIQSYYDSTKDIGFDYNVQSGSGDNDNSQEYYEHNPYSWKATMAKHDMTDGWDLPPNCEQEGETFFGIPLSAKSVSKLLSAESFQEQFDFEELVDRNFTYMKEFGTNHGWLVGEELGNGAGSIVDKDTAHIPIFYTGTTNPAMGGISLENLIKIGKKLDFGTLYIKPAFVFQDDDGSVKLQFEADPNSALGYLYSNLCKMIGISWNYETPYNENGVYTNCAMHASGDRAKYGCGPDNGNSGGFCPQMTLAYGVGFQSEDHAAAFMQRGNDYIDYWRNLYPSGVAVGTTSFCPNGGCLALFLNRYDVFYVFKPDLGGSWVEYMGGTVAPTVSPAPTYDGGCDNPHNMYLDKCFRQKHARKATTVAWESLGTVGQFSIFLLMFMASTLAMSIFLARAKRRRKDGESYLGFLVRDMRGKKKKRKKLVRKRMAHGALDEDFLGDDDDDDHQNETRNVPARPGRHGKTHLKSTPRSDRSVRSFRSSASKTPKSRSRSSRSRKTRLDDQLKDLDEASRSSRGSRSKSRSRSRSKVKPRAGSKSRTRDSSRNPDSGNNGGNRRQLV